MRLFCNVDTKIGFVTITISKHLCSSTSLDQFHPFHKPNAAPRTTPNIEVNSQARLKKKLELVHAHAHPLAQSADLSHRRVRRQRLDQHHKNKCRVASPLQTTSGAATIRDPLEQEPGLAFDNVRRV